MKREQMVECFYPGMLFEEKGGGQVVGHRDPHRVEVPKGAFAFRFYDRVTQTATLEDGGEIEHVKRENESPRYYPGGTVLTLDDIPDTPENGILRSNMECNGYERVVRTCAGNVQPLEQGIVL